MNAFAQRVLLWGGCALASAVFGVMTLSVMARPTNCGGNSFALYNCRHIAWLVIGEMDAGRTDRAAWKAGVEGELARRSKNHWTGNALYFVRTNLNTNLPSATVIAYCNQPFSNVPQPGFANFYRKNPAHAIARMNGESELLSPAEFARLPFAEFVALTNFSESTSP